MQLLRWAEQSEAVIFEDDYDSEFRFSGPPLAALKSLDSIDRVVYAGTFSKLLFPAIRLAYLVLPGRMIRPFVTALSLATRHMPIWNQVILTDFIAEGHFSRHIRRMRTLYAEPPASWRVFLSGKFVRQAVAASRRSSARLKGPLSAN